MAQAAADDQGAPRGGIGSLFQAGRRVMGPMGDDVTEDGVNRAAVTTYLMAPWHALCPFVII